MNNYCLYWAPGSCGDIIQWIFSRNKINTIIKNAEIDENGKINFSSDNNINQFYIKVWQKSELTAIQSSSPFLIGTHLLEQVNYISSQIPVITIGITYNEHQFNSILTAWIKKIGQFDCDVCAEFSVFDKKLIDKFKSHNLYQQYLFKKFTSITNHQHIPKTVPDMFDISIPFDIIEAGDISQILTLLNLKLSLDDIEFFREWYSKQSF